MSGIRARLDRLENASKLKVQRSAVVIMADGHPQSEISAFLADQGIQQDARQPIIVFNSGHTNIAGGDRKPLRMA